MINRELIRTKIVQLVYAYVQNEDKSLDAAERELEFSLLKSYELYKFLLSLLVQVKYTAERREDARLARASRLGVTIVWSTMAIICIAAALFIFAIIKKLNKVS